MELFYLLLVIFTVSSTCGKVVEHDESIHATNNISKGDSAPNTTTTEAVSNNVQNNIEDPLPKTYVSVNATDAQANKDTLAKAFDEDFLIITRLGKEQNLVSTTEKPAKDPLENVIDVEDSLIINIKNKNAEKDNLVLTSTEKSTKDLYGNALDVDFLNIINDYEETQSSETPEAKVDNGTALLLTAFIRDGLIAEARNACRVDPDLFLGFESYSGFLTVDEELKSHLFFWYFPVPDKPVNETPWIVWLQGGPGASSLAGLFDEVGPFTVSQFGTLKKNRYSWIQNHSLLFIDNPVGTGYSFTESKLGYARDLDTYTTHLHEAMKQFVQLFPELQMAPLFVAGESYAGKYVPALAHRIHRHIDSPPHFNLQGVMLGNAMVDPAEIAHISDAFEHFGLIDQTQVEIIRPLVEGFQEDIAQNRSAPAKMKWVSLVSALLLMSHQKHAYNFLRDTIFGGKYTDLLDKSDVKRALHVGDIQFSRVNVTVNIELAPEFLSSTKPMLEELLDHYRVLVYCGQLDQMLPCLQTSKNARTWKWNGTEEFLHSIRYPFIFNGRNAGYHKTGGRLTEVVFRGAGHMVPQDVPAPSQALITRFTHGVPIGPRNMMYEAALHNMHNYLRNGSNLNNSDVFGYF
ncbi:venom serine carboxypeptidase-like [Leguminivora glycinivorella]|uniref:venom serine carboxypeptidase-like n=1 Tax=Leguminivora glycinivorella TaxID=1035111 RepID=UPI00200F620C|nr:venom serine carboxypeptidase-like [Leguminivora glycinivorella]